MAADLPGPDDIPLDPDLLKTLASDSRRDILRLLKQRRMTLTELATSLDLGKATVLEHLKKLQDTGLIVRREDERLWVYYELTPRGKRVVSPGRTRFYIVMAGTAAAALLLGVILTLALTHGPTPATPPGAPALQGTGPVQAQGDLVAWRGLDPGVSLSLSQQGHPVSGTLFVDGAPYPTSDAGAFKLDAAGLDNLPVGNHTLTFLPRDGTAREVVSGFLDVRDPRPALSPLQVPAGRSATVALAFADPATPVPDVVSVGGQSLATQRVPGGAVVTLRAAAPGPLQVQVGRLPPIAVQAVPDLALAFSPDGAGNLTLRVAGPDGAPLAGAQASLDGATLGATDANGTLSFPVPASGVRALRLAGGGGDLTRALRFEGWNVSEAAPAIVLERAAGGFTATVRNDGATPAPLTLAAILDGRLAATQPVEVPPNASLPVRFDVRADLAGSHAAALEARAPLLEPVRFVNGSTQGGTPTSPTPAATTPVSASPTVPTTAEADSSGLPAFEAQDSRVVATLDLGPVTLTAPTSATAYAPGYATPSPKVPGPEVALLLAAGVALALLMRRRT